MRTTVTLDPDVEAAVRRRMEERGVGFKRALNDAIRDGVAPQRGARPEYTRSAPMGVPLVGLHKATQLASMLEDEELLQKMRLGK